MQPRSHAFCVNVKHMALLISIKHISSMPGWRRTDVLESGMDQIKTSLKVKGVTAILNFM